jgi:hypothetical protein
MGIEHLLGPLFLFNPFCSSSSRSLLRGGDLEGGGSGGEVEGGCHWRRGGRQQRGKGRGGQVWGKGGGTKKGEKGGRSLGFFVGEQKRRLR